MFRVKIDTRNDAFVPDEAYEVARILRKLADDIELVPTQEGSLFDANGNKVGWWNARSRS